MHICKWTMQALYTKIKEGVFYFKSHAWRDVSPTAQDLVKRLLDVSQLGRITVHQALAHPWFKMDAGECENMEMCCYCYYSLRLLELLYFSAC